jgi:hypothetical protein
MTDEVLSSVVRRKLLAGLATAAVVPRQQFLTGALL